MKKIFLPLLLALPIYFYAQPQIVATLSYGGPKNGGAIIRTDLPSLTPGNIFSFDNSSPHWPAAGVIAGDGNWLYGITYYGGTNNEGAFYRIQQDGTGFTALYDFSYSMERPLPYFHTDGFVYFSDDNLIMKYNTADGSISSVPAFSTIQTKNLYIDSDDWMYFLEASGPVRLVKMKTDGTAWTELHDFILSTEGGGAVGVTEIPGDSLFGVQKFRRPERRGYYLQH